MSNETSYTRDEHVIYKCGPSTGHVMVPVMIATTPEIADHFMALLTVAKQAADKKVNTPLLAADVLRIMGVRT